MSLAIKRIMIDLLDVIDDPIPNTIMYFDEDNIQNIYVGIIGAADTPYNGGLFIFHFYFTTKYPGEPPRVTFVTPNEKIRFHPNCYEGGQGRVCLSILNTWQGNQWSAVMNLRSLVLSMQSIFTENPLENEPGFENEPISSIRNTMYNDILKYSTLRWAITHVLKNDHIPSFSEQYKKYIKENKTVYAELLEYIANESRQNPNILRSLYNMKVSTEYKQMLNEWNKCVKPLLEA